MVDTVFLHYDRATLDREYDNRSKVPGFADYLARWTARSRALRGSGDGRCNIRYGPGDAEILDLFPITDDRPAPAQVFFHGGYWKSLSKNEFTFVVDAFRPAGAATVIVGYGLVPGISLDELVAQCRRAMVWLWEHGAGYGIDRERLFVSGHSAGGHLVAMLLATDWPAVQSDLPAGLVRGGCGISGLYDLEPIRLCFLNEELGLDRDTVVRNSPLRLRPHNRAPLLLPLGELEGPEYRRQSEDLASAWGRAGLSPEVVVLPDQDHFSIVDQLGDPDSTLSRLIRAQMESVPGR